MYLLPVAPAAVDNEFFAGISWQHQETEMKAKITAPFFWQNNWFFEEDEVTGAAATAAVKLGAATEIKSTRKRKSLKGAPENKAEG